MSDDMMAIAALAYVRKGLAVFPVWPALARIDPKGRGQMMCGCGRLTCESPAKHPIARLAPHGVSDATADEARVRHLWACRPDANIGAAMGSIVAIDVDPRHDGDVALAALEAKHGALPTTWRARTGSGGAHLYFRAPASVIVRNSASRLGPGVDVRARGGYTVLPPSLHVSGRRYTWQAAPDTTALAPLPEWITQALASDRAKAGAGNQAWRDLATTTVTEGRRNDTIARFAGHLLRHYVDPHVVVELLLAWNAAHCQPPLAREEVIKTVNSIAGKELQRRRRSA